MHGLKRNLIPSLRTRLRGSRTFPLHMFMKRDKNNYIHLFNKSLYIARQERLLSDLTEIINLQKANGVKLEEGKSNDKACYLFHVYHIYG